MIYADWVTSSASPTMMLFGAEMGIAKVGKCVVYTFCCNLAFSCQIHSYP